MPRWDDLLDEQQVDQIHAYVISVARQAYAEQQKAGAAAGTAGAAQPAVKEGHL
jgi:mono/diheme cytochrome c family protein